MVLSAAVTNGCRKVSTIYRMAILNGIGTASSYAALYANRSTLSHLATERISREYFYRYYLLIEIFHLLSSIIIQICMS